MGNYSGYVTSSQSAAWQRLPGRTSKTMLFGKMYVICCCEWMELRAALCMQGLSCDQEGRPRPGPGTQLPTPGSVCPPPTRGCAGMGCHSLRALIPPGSSIPAKAPGTNIGWCPRYGGHQGYQDANPDRLWGMGLGWLVGIGCSGEQTPAGTLPKRVPILPPPPRTPRRPRTRSRAACGPPPAPALIAPLPKAGRKDGKLHTSVSGKLPGHLRSILPLHPRALSPTSCSSLRCGHKDISGSKEVNASGRRRRGRGKRFP